MLFSTHVLPLGALYLSGQGYFVSARPFGPYDEASLHERQSVTLSNTSSCNDLQNYQTQNGLTRIQADMYNMLNAHGFLDSYFFASGDGVFTNYVSGFAAPLVHTFVAESEYSYGVGQTFSCLIPDTCPRINCADLQDPDAPGTGPAYAILLSFANFNQYLEDLWEALNLSKDDWNGVQVKLQQTYYPFQPPPIFLRELINGLTAVAGVIAASSGVIGATTAAITGSAAALLSGVFGGINLALSTTDESLAHLAELEANTQVWYQNIFNQLVWANNNLTGTGYYIDNSQGVAAGLADIIADGVWLDYTSHPVLNDDSSKPQVTIDALKQALYDYLIGNMINYAWKAQGTFIVKYDMSEDDFNSKGNDWAPGYGDPRFRSYADGSAYFLQRYTSDQDPLTPSPVSAYPPGWGETAGDLNGCDPSCILRSAGAGFVQDGYGFNFSTTATDYTSDQATALGWLTDLPSAPGFFNVPVVDLTGNERVPDIDKLNDILEDQKHDYGEADPKALYCYVEDFTDKNGVKFSDQLPSDVVQLFERNCEQGYWG